MNSCWKLYLSTKQRRTLLPQSPACTIDVASQQGIALVVSLLILLMMSILTSALIYRAGSELGRSNQWELSQDAFSAAETGLQEGQRWLMSAFAGGQPPSKILPVQPCAGGGTNCCTARLNLAAAFPQSQPTPLAHAENKKLSDLVTGASAKLSYEFFIAPVDLSTGTKVGTGKGGSVGVGRGHKGGGAASSSYYRIWSCGYGTDRQGQMQIKSPVRALEITVSKNN